MDKSNVVTMEEIIEMQDLLAEEIMQLQYSRYPDLIEKYGKVGHRHCIQDIKYNFGFFKGSYRNRG